MRLIEQYNNWIGNIICSSAVPMIKVVSSNRLGHFYNIFALFSVIIISLIGLFNFHKQSGNSLFSSFVHKTKRHFVHFFVFQFPFSFFMPLSLILNRD